MIIKYGTEWTLKDAQEFYEEFGIYTDTKMVTDKEALFFLEKES